MARVNAILLLTLFLLNSLGGITLLLIQRYKNREYIAAMIRSDFYRHRLTTITIPLGESSEITWVEKNKEFRYHGDMYDVVRAKSSSDGSMIIHCIRDNEETQLYADIESNLNASLVGHNSDRTIVLKIFNFLSTLSIPNSSETRIDVCEKQKCEIPYVFSTGSNSLQVLVEPPEWV